MLTKEENDFLTQTGPGTPGGEFMRRYWLPAALSEDLPPDGPPLGVRILGEDLVLFRDGRGQLGLLGRGCPHRGADLAYGLVEEAGLRCYYHGWLYNTHGRCLEQPLEPPESKFHETIRHLAYPCQEKAGIIFAYLGPGEPPLLPAYEFLALPDEHRRSAKYLQQCNYLQANEGNVDPFQLLFLRQILGRRSESGGDADFQQPTIDSEDTDFGIRLFTVRRGKRRANAVEVRNFLLPSLCAVPGIGLDGYTVHWHVPIDDTHHWRYVVAFRRDAPMTEEDGRRNGIQTTPDYRLTWDRADLESPDDQEMGTKLVAYSMAMAESQGAILDRTLEHLGSADAGILAMRTIVHKAIQDVQEGADPPHLVRSPEANDFAHVVVREDVVPSSEDWRTYWQK